MLAKACAPLSVIILQVKLQKKETRRKRRSFCEGAQEVMFCADCKSTPDVLELVERSVGPQGPGKGLAAIIADLITAQATK